ncbi:MAG: nucleotidyltransferase domain-containing protein [Elusimicrobia bacterium]|nr:nucleotidyltransferase domain-containing protein [Elusimicrobiota bacterium]
MLSRSPSAGVDLRRIKALALAEIFKRIPKDDCVVFLFGTCAAGSQVRDSDIDIGVLASSPIPPSDFLELQESLDAELPTLRRIDFVDFRDVSETVRREALKEIVIWHAGKNCRGLLKDSKRR